MQRKKQSALTSVLSLRERKKTARQCRNAKALTLQS
jgi:hypothetical protein